MSTTAYEVVKIHHEYLNTYPSTNGRLADQSSSLTTNYYKWQG